MTKKEARYRVQESYDEMMSQIRQNAMQDFQEPITVPTSSNDTQVDRSAIIKVIEDLFEGSDAQTLLMHIELKMASFINMGRYYKAESKNGRRDILDSILLVMAEVYEELKPYEIVVRMLHPTFNPFFDTLSKWYHENKDRMYDNRMALYSDIINA